MNCNAVYTSENRTLRQTTPSLISRLESKTDELLQLFDESRRDDPIHTELERIRHEKEELEWQNHRLIERMAKLKFILKGLIGRVLDF